VDMTYTQSTVEGLIRAAALKGWSAGRAAHNFPAVTLEQLQDMERQVLAEVKAEYLDQVEHVAYDTVAEEVESRL